MNHPSDDVKVYDTRLCAGSISVIFLLPLVVLACFGDPAWWVLLFIQILPLLLYQRLRLDAEEGTLYICGVIPVSCVIWRNVVQHEECFAGTICFKMDSGVCHRWTIGIFGDRAQKAIAEFLQRKCPQIKPKPPSPDKWLEERIRQNNRGDWIVLAVSSVLFLVGLVFLISVLICDGRVHNWTQVLGGLLRHDLPTLCFVLQLINILFFVLRIRRRKRLSIPEKLRTYAAAHSVPATRWSHSEDCYVTRPPRFQGRRFFIAKESWLLWGIITVPLIGCTLAAVAFFPKEPLLYFILLCSIAGIMAAMPKTMVLDLQERRLTLDGILRRKREISLEDVHSLNLWWGGDTVQLNAFRQNGTCVRLFRVRERFLPKLLEALPDIAEQMGQLPVSFSQSPLG